MSDAARQELVAADVDRPVDDIQHDPPPRDTTPPQLPAPQIDLTLSVDAILDGIKENTKDEKLEKLDEENNKLDKKLKEMQDRLAAAERKSKELEAKRRSQQQN